MVVLLLQSPIDDSAIRVPASVSLAPSEEPTEEEKRLLWRWRQSYREEMIPVRRDWSMIARTIRQGNLDRLPELCRRFESDIRAIDRERLLLVPDPVLRLHLGRGLKLLVGAGEQCNSGRVFDLVHHLSQARAVFMFVDARFKRYR